MNRVGPLRLTRPGDSVDLNAFLALLSVRPRTKVGYVARLRPPPQIENHSWSVRDPDLIELTGSVAAARVSHGRTVARGSDANGGLVVEIPLIIAPLSDCEVLVEFDQIVTFPETIQRGPDLGALDGNGLLGTSKKRVELSSDVDVSIGSILRSRDSVTIPQFEVEKIERRSSTVVVSGPEVFPPLASPSLIPPPERLR